MKGKVLEDKLTLKGRRGYQRVGGDPVGPPGLGLAITLHQRDPEQYNTSSRPTDEPLYQVWPGIKVTDKC